MPVLFLSLTGRRSVYMGPVVQLSFNANVRVDADKVDFAYDRVALNSFMGLDLGAVSLTSPVEIDNPARIEMAPYIKRLFLQLLEHDALHRSVRFDLAYVCLDHDVPPVDSGAMVVAYDVTRCGSEPLLPAMIAKAVHGDPKQVNVLLEFEAVIELWKAGVLKPEVKKRAKTLARITVPPFFSVAGRIIHDIEITSYKHTESTSGAGEVVTELSFSDKVEYYRYPLGEFARLIPIPRFPDITALPEHAIVVGRPDNTECDSWSLSEEVWHNLTALQNAMSGNSKKTVLVRGEPGSGKEIYARAIHFGSIRPREDAFVRRSIANLETPTLNRELYGEMTAGGHHLPGLIHRAEGGSLFLDEFDKVHDSADGFYGGLLRVLEAKEYVPVNGNSVKEIGDVNWILAGAFSGARTIEDLPPDIWTRFSHEVRIENPIHAESLGYTAALFLYWFFVESLKILDGDFERLFRNRSYKLQRLRQVLFGAPEPVNRDDPLEAGRQLVQFAMNLANYSGEYFLFFEREASGQRKRVFVPRFCELVAGLPNGPCQVLPVLAKPNSEPVGTDARFAYLDMNSLKDEDLTDFVYESRFDSVRAIRQATLVAFKCLYESALELGAKFELATPAVESLSDEAREAMREAIRTLDIARPGEKAEDVLDRNGKEACVKSSAAY
ncbi:MAG: sigma 54-interacting transcriptional regulator [Planctomycetota bacterium]|nr:sigma 54-interacting transcriptional regulator [Planctomycetota bacterium]